MLLLSGVTKMVFLKLPLMFMALLFSIALFILANLWTKVVRTLFWVLPRAVFAMIMTYFDGRGGDVKTGVFMSSLTLFFVIYTFDFQLPISNYLNRYQQMSDDMYHTTFSGYDNKLFVEDVNDKQFFALTDRQKYIFNVYAEKDKLKYANSIYPNPVKQDRYYNPFVKQDTDKYFEGGAAYVQYYDDFSDGNFNKWIGLFNKGFEFKADHLDTVGNVYAGHFVKERSTDDLSSLYPIERSLKYSGEPYSLLPQFADFVLLLMLLWAITSSFIFDSIFKGIKRFHLPQV